MKCNGLHLNVKLGRSKVYPCGTQAFVTQLLYKLLRRERIRKSDRYVKSTSRLRKSFDLRKKKNLITLNVTIATAWERLRRW